MSMPSTSSYRSTRQSRRSEMSNMICWILLKKRILKGWIRTTNSSKKIWVNCATEKKWIHDCRWYVTSWRKILRFGRLRFTLRKCLKSLRRSKNFCKRQMRISSKASRVNCQVMRKRWLQYQRIIITCKDKCTKSLIHLMVKKFGGIFNVLPSTTIWKTCTRKPFQRSHPSNKKLLTCS